VGKPGAPRQAAGLGVRAKPWPSPCPIQPRAEAARAYPCASRRSSAAGHLELRRRRPWSRAAAGRCLRFAGVEPRWSKRTLPGGRFQEVCEVEPHPSAVSHRQSATEALPLPRGSAASVLALPTPSSISLFSLPAINYSLYISSVDDSCPHKSKYGCCVAELRSLAKSASLSLRNSSRSSTWTPSPTHQPHL
jgi:hypothetical protein